VATFDLTPIVEALAEEGGPDPRAAPGAASCGVPVEPLPPDGTPITQWASAASATSEYGPISWAATQVTGPPDTPTWGDAGTAWTPAVMDGGIEWLTVSLPRPVVPTGIAIVENLGAGGVVALEGWDEACSVWVPLWEGTDPSSGPPVAIFRPPIGPAGPAMGRYRITIDTALPDWQEIDAVELVGMPPG